jgi:hypothetical protein
MLIHYRRRLRINGNNVSMPEKKSNSSNQKIVRGRKEMTGKKSKTNSITHKTDNKYRLKEVQKKNQNTNKRIETFLPVSNEETPKN